MVTLIKISNVRANMKSRIRTTTTTAKTKPDETANQAKTSTQIATDMTAQPATTTFVQKKSLFDDRYRLNELLGSGTFGSVHRAVDTLANDTGTNADVAIKISDLTAGIKEEIRAYRHLEEQGVTGGYATGFPRMLHYVLSETQNYLVMQRLGPSIRDHWKYCGRHFTIKTGLMLGLQLVNLLQVLHATGLVHADVKENNFVTGHGSDENMVYIIDFGMAEHYIDENTGLHVEDQSDPHAVGTIAYASVHVHKKMQYTRRDDLESMIYMLINLVMGYLPWKTDCSSQSFDENFETIGGIKERISAEDVCRGLPYGFTRIVKYIRLLKFDERPDYEFITAVFQQMLDERGYKNDRNFDWV